jgi:hypothetical protein
MTLLRCTGALATCPDLEKFVVQRHFYDLSDSFPEAMSQAGDVTVWRLDGNGRWVADPSDEAAKVRKYRLSSMYGKFGV